VSLRRLSMPQGILTAGQKSAEGVVGRVVGRLVGTPNRKVEATDRPSRKRWLLARAQWSDYQPAHRRCAGAGNQSSRSAVRLYDAGLHNRSRNRTRNWVHSRIRRSRDYFLSTPPTRQTASYLF
jgi:hypothetical protein